MVYPWGIDFGNVNCVVAVARRGGIDTLANEASSRQTPALVGFSGKQRTSGEGAAAAWQSNLNNTISEIKQLVGRKWNDPQLQAMKERMPFEIVEGQNGGIAVKVNYDGSEVVFLPEQIVAILLKNLQRTAVAANGPSPDCVISVPVYFTDVQRRAMLDAAEIAGLHVLRLINEPAAAALAYGLPKSPEFPDDSAEPQRVLFFDMGHHSTTSSLVAFTKSKLQVLGSTFDRNLGGRDFDEILVDQFVHEFDEKYKLSLRSNPKAVHRVRLACQKLKVNLSGVPKMPINVECLMNEIDFSSTMEREAYEKLSEPLIQRALEPVKRLLADTKVQFDQINSIQLVGSATRMPAVVKALKDFFGIEPQRALNSEECIAKGCALAAAMISPAFKVREFSVVDLLAFPVNLSWPNPPAEGETEPTSKPNVLFTKYNIAPHSKVVTFKKKPDIQLSLDYAEADTLPENHSTHIADFSVTNIPKEHDSVKVKLVLDMNGVVNVTEAIAEHVYEIDVPIPPAPKPAPAPAAAAAPAEEKPASEAMDVDEKGAAAAAAEGADTEMNEAPAAAPAEPAAAAEPAAEEPKFKKEKKKTLTNCAITRVTPNLGVPEVKRLKEREFEMSEQDRHIVETQDKRNELEEYVYNTRERLTGDLEPYCLPDERESFTAKLTAMEDWLYTEECETAGKGKLQEKLDSLKHHGDPIVLRYKEEIDRVSAIDKLKETITEMRTLASSVEEKYSHITDEERQKAIAECDKISKFLQEKIEAQEAQPKHLNPVFKSSELSLKATILCNTVRPIMNRPKPKEEKKAAPAPAAAPTTEAADADAQPSEDLPTAENAEETPADAQENSNPEPMALD